MTPPKAEDLRAGITGLIVAAVLLLTLMVTIVTVTTRHYASEKGAAQVTK